MDDVTTWLRAVKAILLAEGFKRDPLQIRKPGQVWGLVRQEPEQMQIHVRAFEDGRLESEVELSNKYVQHLWSHRRNAAPEVKAILERRGFPTERVSETFVPITGTKEGKQMPDRRLRNRDVAIAVAVGIGILIGRQYAKRVVLRRIPAKAVKATGAAMLARKLLARR